MLPKKLKIKNPVFKGQNLANSQFFKLFWEHFSLWYIYIFALLHVPDGTTRKVLILFLQEIKRDIIFHRAQLAEPRRREELQTRIQAHLLSVISKLQSFLEYQGVLNYTDVLALLRRMEHSTLHD
jgi:hypothetical protein